MVVQVGAQSSRCEGGGQDDILIHSDSHTVPARPRLTPTLPIPSSPCPHPAPPQSNLCKAKKKDLIDYSHEILRDVSCEIWASLTWPEIEVVHSHGTVHCSSHCPSLVFCGALFGDQPDRESEKNVPSYPSFI